MQEEVSDNISRKHEMICAASNVCFKICKVIIYVVLGIQIVLGIVWAVMNMTAVPCFGDTTEYLQLSESLKPDEYRTILYPLLLRIATKIGNRISVPYQTLMYIGQLAASFLSVFWLWEELLSKEMNRRLVKKIFFTLAIMTIPIVNFLNLTILTDSLALSCLLVVLGRAGRIWNGEKVNLWDVGLMGAALLAEDLVRADRIYTCTLFFVAYGGVLLVRRRLWTRFLFVICTVLTVSGAALAINTHTQTRGLYGRVETNLDYILLDRVVWPNMAENYENFSDDIKRTISLEEAEKFDEHNNNVMYFLAPLVQERVGKARASEMYREMAGVVWHNEKGTVMGDIGKCFCGFLFPHTNACLSYYGKTETNNGWNLHCMSTRTPKLSDYYYRYYIITIGVVLFAVAILLTGYRLFVKRDAGFAGYLRKLLPMLGICVLICAWFSLGDGAPPNDRYVTICHVLWNAYIYGAVRAAV